MEHVLVSLSIFFACFILALVFTRFCLIAARKLAFLDHPKGRKNHAAPVPLLGGAGIYLSLFAGVYLPVIVLSLWPDVLVQKFPFLENYMAGALKKLPLLHVVFLTGLGLLITGLIDDKRGMNPYVKLFLQVLAGSIMYLFGVRITLFVKSEVFSYAVTTFWFVLLINSFNLLDNMDGLSAGIGMIVSIMMFFISHFFGNFLMASLSAATAGALLGFLVFNFHPARIFMGDAGALFLGFMMAVIMILTTYYQPNGYPRYVAYLVPLIVLMVPLYDTFSVIVVRLIKGESIMKGDRNHFSHRLVRLGMGVRYAALFLYFITFTTGISALFLFWVGLTGAVLVMIQVFCLFGIIVILEYYAKKGNEK
ncbi:MAG: undecaprenyl/decaprenyl-phosphate alpha-N-acetylglucosaminyl 1-phosphate transferase [Candidatus Aureabacteria bacterium]|nr:undecaprenyl/decaprenyl-phosphate alpha-N-acetylglucosaminyl 1-phosphate transferase [Candidatus Auribacterota bacterium]